MKCIVKDCPNHEHEGRFSAELCFPCFRFIATGEGVHSQAYRNVQKAVEEEREECAKLCEALSEREYQTGKVDHNERAWTDFCATAIRARGEK
jgi:hypothetical protein